MTTEAIAIPSFSDLAPEAITAFASQNLAIMREEARAVKSLTKQAAQRARAIGAACVHLKDNKIIQPELWEDWAKENIGGGDYQPVWRSMRFYRMSPERPPGRVSAQFKQLQIMFGEEPLPKVTPRKSDVKKFANFKAACTAIVRWWRGGDVAKGVDSETLREIADDLRPVAEVYAAILQRLEETP